MAKEIKYNDRGEVVSVNGLTTGHHIGAPMQDAIGTEEENSAYGTELGTVTNAENIVDDLQPTASSADKYDLVLETSAFVIYEMTKDTVTLVSGDANACAEKMKSGGVCRALLRVRETYGDEFITNKDVECDVRWANGTSVVGHTYDTYLRSFSIMIDNDNSIAVVYTSKYSES